MEKVLKLRRNRLDQRKETEEDYRDDYKRVSHALSNLTCCWIG